MIIFLKFHLPFLVLYFFSIVYCHGQKVGTYLIDSTVNMESITWSPNGKIYVLDFKSGSVYRVEKDTLKLIVTGFEHVSGGGTDLQGNFYFGVHPQGKIYRINHDDSVDLIAIGLYAPVGLQLSNNSEFFYVVDFDNNSVKKVWIADGKVEDFVINQGLRGPDGIVAKTDGNLLVANFTNNRIHEIALNGEVRYFGEHSYEGNMGYIAKASNYFYVASVSGHTIERFDQIGNRTKFAGSGIKGYMDGNALDAQFSKPRGITSNPAGDTLLITEEGGRIRYITELQNYPIIVEDVKANSIFKIFPNPTFDWINVDFKCESDCQIVKLEILNTSGKIISKQTYQTINNEIHKDLYLPKFSAGLYFLKLYVDNEYVGFKKIVKLIY